MLTPSKTPPFPSSTTLVRSNPPPHLAQIYPSIRITLKPYQPTRQGESEGRVKDGRMGKCRWIGLERIARKVGTEREWVMHLCEKGADERTCGTKKDDDDKQRASGQGQLEEKEKGEKVTGKKSQGKSHRDCRLSRHFFCWVTAFA